MIKDTLRLYALFNGTLLCDSRFGTPFDPEPATRDNKTPAIRWREAPVNHYLIFHPQIGWILYETGMHPEAMTGRWPSWNRQHWEWNIKSEDQVENKLKILGVAPKDINTVIVGHIHQDHTGCNYLFKKSRFLVHRRELEYALLVTRIGANCPPEEYKFHPSCYVKPDPYIIKEDFDIPGINYTVVQGDFELAPGIEVIELEGHHPGILGLIIHLPKTGTVILTSDAFNAPWNYNPPMQLGVIYDLAGFYRTIQKVHTLEKKYNARIFFPHDSYDQKGEKLIYAPEGVYE